MKMPITYLIVVIFDLFFDYGISIAQIKQKSFIKYYTETNQIINITNNPPTAVNDTFTLLTGCNNNTISGNVLLNDFDSDGDEIKLYFIETPHIGEFAISDNGEFTLTIYDVFWGDIKAEYYINEVSKSNYKAIAVLLIKVRPDNDCDNISDEDDIDDDNDGILDIDEGDGNTDFDNDGIPDSYDIDSDNDGIIDIEEWQCEGFYSQPENIDINLNGWDDAFDVFVGGNYYKAIDTDMDGQSDFIDIDSDNDGIYDFIEGYDTNEDGIPEICAINLDSDSDGLDDSFDCVQGWILNSNYLGCNAPLPDLNKNGIRAWRDTIKNYTLIPEQAYLYPNPSIGIITVRLPAKLYEQTTYFSLFSLSGELLFREAITDMQCNIDLTHIKCGIYLAKIQSEEFIQTYQIIINH